MLIVFDNSVNQAHINEYCIENPRIKYLATSRSNEWDTIMQIKKFSPDESSKKLQGVLDVVDDGDCSEDQFGEVKAPRLVRRSGGGWGGGVGKSSPILTMPMHALCTPLHS